MLQLSYTEIFADKAAALERIGRFLDFDWSRAEVARAVAEVELNRAANRFNQGRNGRGAESLRAAQKDRIVRLANPFPSVDFSPIGL